MNNTHEWRTRVAFLVTVVALWVAVWPLAEWPLAQRIVIGLAILTNVLYFLTSFAAPTSLAYGLGEQVGREIGYQAGYRDGLTAGAEMTSGGRTGAEIIGLMESPSPEPNGVPQ